MPEKNIKSAVKKERGSVLIEFSVTLPIIMLTLFNVVDLGFCLNQYLRVSRITYEGARFASTIAGLEENSYLSDKNHTTLVTNPAIQHSKIHNRIMTLLSDNGLPSDLGSISIRTEYGLNGPPPGGVQTHNVPRIIYVNLEVPYHSLFPFVPTLTMNVTRSGPYLYRPQT